MRYAKTVLVAAMLASSLALLSSNGETPATRPAATQPAKILLRDLAKSNQQKLTPVDSVGLRVGASGAKPPPARKVILIAPPKQYADWFAQESGYSVFDNFRIEATPTTQKVLVTRSGLGGFQASVENVIIGKIVDTGWDVEILQSENSEPNVFGRACDVSGVIQIDVRPNHRYTFPFKAEFEIGERRSDGPLLGATVTWKKPECWKRDE